MRFIALGVVCLVLGWCADGRAQLPIPANQLQQAAAGGGGVSFDKFTGGSSGDTTTPLVISVTPVGTPSAVIVVVVGLTSDECAPVTTTYGAATLTRQVDLAHIDSGNWDARVQIFSTTATPPSGTQNFTFTSVDVCRVHVGIYTVTGSNTTAPVRATNTATGATSAVSVAVTSATTDLVIDGVFSGINTAGTPGGGQTVGFNTDDGTGAFEFMSSYKTGSASSTTMSWTAGTFNWGQAAVSVKP